MKVNFRSFVLLQFACLYFSNLIAQVTVDFTSDVQIGCTPLLSQFSDQSKSTAGNIVKWTWEFSNGSQSSIQNPAATFMEPGVYSVKLSVEDDAGNKNSITKEAFIKVSKDPIPNFSYSDSVGCTPLKVKFTDLSDPGDGVIKEWLWEFGDDSKSNEQNPLIDLVLKGKYATALTVTNTAGCSGTAKKGAIKVAEVVEAKFKQTDTVACSPPLKVTFANGTQGEGPFDFVWDFGDGTTKKANDFAQIVHEYTKPGTYSVQLTATSPYCNSKIIKEKLIAIGEVNTGFEVSTNKICKGEKISFSNKTVPAPEKVFWNFGDGKTSAEISPTLSFDKPGKYTVTLKCYIKDCVDSLSKQIEVLPNAEAGFVGDKLFICNPPLTVKFTNQSKDATGYNWSFGDGGVSTVKNPSHTYTAAGSYAVSLKATNSLGCANQIIKNGYVQVNNPALTNFSVKKDKAPLTYNFRAIYSTIGSDPPASFLWDFGDGGTSANPTPQHKYAVEKTYDVTCTITTKNGCIITLTKKVNIADIGGGGAFEADPRNSCAIDIIKFTDKSVLADRWLWEFGDGGTSTKQHPEYRYKIPGDYTVSLTIWSDGNFMDSVGYVDYIHIKEGPISSINTIQSCVNKDQVKFFPDTGDYVDTYLWKFGDGKTSNKKEPTHTYDKTGEYKVWQIVKSNSSNCVDSSSFKVKIINETPKFVASETVVCKGDSILFTASDIQMDYVKSLYWNFGNGDVISTTNLEQPYVYKDPGVFSVMLSLKDNNGCVDSLKRKNYLKVGGPESKIVANNLLGCAPLTIDLTDSSSWAKACPVVLKTWDLGNGEVNTVSLDTNHHQVLYTEGGKFNLSLNLLDTFGCTWKDSLEVNVIQPKALLDVSDTTNCPNRPILFRNLSNGEALAYKWYFGDGEFSTELTPSHSYAKGGFYTISLVLKDTNGCSDSLGYVDYIKIYEPKADFNMSEPTAVFPPILVNFESLSENATDHYWDFGDFSTSVLEDPEHSYDVADTFEVTLIVSANGGCSDTLTKTLAIKSVEGEFRLSADTGCVPQTIVFEAKGFNAKSFIWDFEDGNILETTDSKVQHIYESPGVYQPKIILDKGNGKRIVVVSDEKILIDLAKADFSIVNDHYCDTVLAPFNNLSESFTAPTYFWDFGNGTQSNEENPSTTYSQTGGYNVSLKLVTAAGCEDIVNEENKIVLNILPDALIEGDTAVCEENLFSFNAKHQIEDESLSYLWQSEDRIFSYERAFSMSLEDAGNYPIMLTIENGAGCLDSAFSNLIIRPNPNAEIITEDTIICQNVEFMLRAKGGAVYQWMPNIALSCNNCQFPLISPMENQNYQLRVENQFGCIDHDSIKIEVKDAPVLNLIDDGNICKNGHYELGYSGDVDSVVWFPHTWLKRPNSTNPISYPEESITYRAVGYKNTKFCDADTGFVSVTVHPDPIISAGDDLTVYARELLKLGANSNDNIAEWEWIGSGEFNCRDCEDPEASFLRDTYLKVIGTSEYGCVGEDDLFIRVLCDKGGLFIPNAFSPNGDGLNDRFYLNGVGVEEVKTFKIFNRWGTVVYEQNNFQLNNEKTGWDGSYNGNILPSQTLVYYAEVKCDQGTQFIVKGFFTLVK